MRMQDAVHQIETAVGDPRHGLPDAVFRLLTRITPMVNVDLLIQENGRTLLTWRDDPDYRGWHVPGGIIRYQERMADRLVEVAKLELGTTVTAKPVPIAVNEIIQVDRSSRGHFISFLFECALTAPLDETRRHRGGRLTHGEWAWHERTPDDIIVSHDVYRRLIDGG